MPTLQELNPSQQAAVEHTEGPIMVLAGPGTGKTRVVTNKIAHLILNEGYKPDEILALTFSNKAAGEMEDRVGDLLPGTTGLNISTFHAFCNDVVRTHSLELGLDASGTVISDEFQKAFLLDHLDDLGLEFFDVPNRPIELAETFQGAISRFKQENIKLDQLVDYLGQHQDDNDDEIAKLRDLAKAYEAYENFKADKRLQDFGDMQLFALKLFTEKPNILRVYRKKLRYIIVDEFQDTDFIQLQILFKLAPEGNITVVADDDQSIYRFRGAYSTNMKEFREFYGAKGTPVTQTVLDINYRCTGNIQQVAGNLIAHNPERVRKEITTQKDEGEPVGITHYLSDWEQAKGITNTILALNKAGTEWKDIAILVRRRIDSLLIIENLEKAGIPIEIIGAREYFREPVIRAVVAYLKVLNDPSNDSPSLAKLMLRPVHGIIQGEIPRLNRYARDKRISVWEALSNLDDYPGDTKHFRRFREELDRLFLLMGDEGLLHLVRAVLFGKDLFRIEIEEDRKENIRLLSRFLELTVEFLEVYPTANLSDFLVHLQALADLKLEEASTDLGSGQVHLMTVHSSKGKEFPIVFIPCLNKNRFPSRYKPYKIGIPTDIKHGVDPNEDPKAMHEQEERRLCYVATTRGEQQVFLSSCEMYGTNVRPTPRSIFLDEIEAAGGSFEKTVRTDEEEELEERSSSVESAICHELYSGIHRGEWQHALEAMTALAKHQQADVAGLPFADELDLEKYLEGLNVKTAQPAIDHLQDIVYSPSRLGVYEDCPKRYYYSHVLAIPGLQKTFFALGSIVHEVTEIVSKKIMNGQDVNLDEALGLLESRWRPSAYESTQQEHKDHEDAVQMIQDFMARQATKDTQILDVERWVEVDIKGRKIRGKVDRIDDVGESLQVIDYKSSKNRTSKPKLKKDFQMALYHLGVQQAFDKPVGEVGHWYLRMDQEWMVELGEEELGAVKQRALEVIEGIETGRFDTAPDFNTCKWCDYWALCGDEY